MERIKTKRQRQNMASIDRLSGLSDDILRHILSFLPTKLSVSTSILAKRWRFLWAHIPSLHFEGETSLDVIHTVMVLHKLKNIDTFSLSDMRHCNEYQLETVITTAIDRNVRKLNLLSVIGVLPQCLFTSKTLVNLRLDKCICILLGGSPTYLPSLKRLYLHGFEYLVKEALPRLLSGCPVLEELCIIDGAMGPNLRCLNISSSSLKKLEINCVMNPNHTTTVVINAPTLTYLKVSAGYVEQLSLSPMTSLIEADMCLYCWTLSPGSLFACFPNVKCLKLSGSPWKFAGAELSDSFVHFDCLTKLELGPSVDWDLDELFKFLEIADKLEVLIAHKVRMPSDRGDWMDPRKGCLLHSLKTLTILHFGCTENELCVLKYVLRNAMVLKRVEIYSGSSGLDLGAKYDMVKRILLFDRGSTECKVAFD